MKKPAQKALPTIYSSWVGFLFLLMNDWVRKKAIRCYPDEKNRSSKKLVDTAKKEVK
jgi:hypothetical protein